MGRTAYVSTALGLLCLALFGVGHGLLAGELPPLDVGDDAPRLEEPEEQQGQEEQTGPTADNHHCFVCHGNYRGETLTKVHAEANIGCMQCHGSSDAHRGDEANITPPDRMFPVDKINSYCRTCHKKHDVAPEKMMNRWLDRAPHRTGARRTVCTDCHGEHRLHSRDTRWNKRTGELLRPLDPTMPKGADQNHHDGVFVPEHTKLLSAGKPVKSSSSRLISGCLQAVTDGVIRADNGPQLTLPRGKQWIEIDLGKKARIHAVMVWHAPGSDRSYRDVIVQLSPNRNFGQKARTIFNNDIDNSSGVGRGLDPEWTEGPNGKLIEAGGLKARYVRLYSSGNSDNDRNHYTEVRVYGTTRLPQRDSEN